MAYQFHSWARKSIANQISIPDHLGKGSVPADTLLQVPLSLVVSGQSIEKKFSIAGPGDIIGIQTNMIVRTDPRPNSGDFEPNYFAAIEFYDEDFPWRYSPAAPVGVNQCRLRPWLMLIVLNENEFEKTTRTSPLHSIVVTDGTALPPFDEIHLWAHVHSNLGEENSPLDDVLDNLSKKSALDPDGLFSRIVCPRKLQENVLYHAFLVPVFEAGRLAGLDLPSNTVPVQLSAWNAETMQVELPVYYRWQFRTGANADFESLVKMLEARKDLDPKIGIRKLDCSHPGYLQVDQPGDMPAPSPEMIGMFAAVKKVDATAEAMTAPVEAQEFVKGIEKHLNMLVPESDSLQDPVVTIPFYGFHYAKTPVVKSPVFEPAKDAWYNEINRDPRNRSAAGLGTRVVQLQQEKLMQRAWAQLSKINEINKKVKHLQLAMEVNERMVKSTFMKVKNETGKVLAITAPVIKKLKDISRVKTVYQALTNSQVPNAAFSPAFRRLSRPNGRISRELKKTGTFSFNRVYAKLNPKVPVVVTTNEPEWLPTFVGFQMNANLPAAIPDITTINSNININPSAVPFRPVAARITPDILVNPDRVNPERVSPQLVNPERVTVTAAKPLEQEMKAAFDLNQAISSISVKSESSAISIPDNYNAHIADSLLPINTLLHAFRAKIPGLPKQPATQEEVLPVMAYPDFPEPVYKYLSQINQDFIIPNLELVPPNTIALMQTNFTFIYSYLTGLNHEMGRELLWREYPTDQRGSYFRQFWDPGGFRSPDSPDQSPDRYKDIKPIHQWNNSTRLNEFNKIGYLKSGEPLILLVKGELLKKYPNTIVFAQRAVKKASGELILDPVDSMDKFKFPSFSGNLAPDVKLLGFDLTKKDVLGVNDEGKKINEGWFFVIAEVPGEPRFGLDIKYDLPEEGKNSWNDLSLEQLDIANPFVSGAEFPSPNTPAGGWPTDDQSPDTIDIEKWGRSSADMAGILLQKPVMIAIHATEMLKDL